MLEGLVPLKFIGVLDVSKDMMVSPATKVVVFYHRGDSLTEFLSDFVEYSSNKVFSLLLQVMIGKALVLYFNDGVHSCLRWYSCCSRSLRASLSCCSFRLANWKTLYILTQVNFRDTIINLRE